MKIIQTVILFVILAVSLDAADKPKLTFNATPNSGIYFFAPEKVYYQRCSSCGRDVPSRMGWFIEIWLGDDKPYTIAERKAMFPYGKGRWFICMRCILEKLGIKPDWKMPATSPED